MGGLLSPMNYGSLGQAGVCPCQFLRVVPLEHRIARRARPTEDNAPWRHCLSLRLRASIWTAVPASVDYCFRLSRNRRIGSNAYSMSVRLPTDRKSVV